LPIGEDLLRAVHTLHGAIAMVDIPLLTQLLSPLESLLKRLRALPICRCRPMACAARAIGRSGRSRHGQFDVAEPQLPNTDALTAQLIEMRDRYPESQVAHVVFEPRPTRNAGLGSRYSGASGNDETAMAASLDASMDIDHRCAAG
jgi:chemosensory pili system protein ChpA (sensor histidine kinase/response regulator)